VCESKPYAVDVLCVVVGRDDTVNCRRKTITGSAGRARRTGGVRSLASRLGLAVAILQQVRAAGRSLSRRSPRMARPAYEFVPNVAISGAPCVRPYLASSVHRPVGLIPRRRAAAAGE